MDWLVKDAKSVELDLGSREVLYFMSNTYSFQFDSYMQGCTISSVNPPVSSLWKVKLELVVKVKPSERKPLLIKRANYTLCYQDQKTYTGLWSRAILKPYCDVNNKLRISVSLRIIECHGFPGYITDSSLERLKNSVDAILEVEDRQISVNKAFLSIYSPFFDTLFNGDFKEKNENIFKLEETNYEQFVCLLRVLHGFNFVNDKSYLFLLELSERYQVDRLRSLCEDYIVGHVKMGYRYLEFLELADKYTLCRLQQNVISSITDMSDVRYLSRQSGFKNLSTSSQALILSICLDKCKC